MADETERETLAREAAAFARGQGASRKRIFADIAAEYERQGTNGQLFVSNELRDLARRYMGMGGPEHRTALVKIAALAVAQIEAVDRNGCICKGGPLNGTHWTDCPAFTIYRKAAP